MTFTSHTHTISSAEIKAVTILGFSVQSSSALAEDFINTHFPNFELFLLLEAIDSVLAALTKKTVSRELILADGATPKMEILFYSSDYDDENMGLMMWRTFTVESQGIIVDHDFFRIPRAARGKGVFKKILRAFFQQYVNIGAGKIRVHAALEDGGLAWAKLGFRAIDKVEVDEILRKASATLSPAQFNLMRLPYDRYYSQNPAGQAFPIIRWAEISFMEPILKQSNWHGVVDLTNPQEFSNFVVDAFE
jgi:hypothetical protein